ncbi:Terminase small subunit [Phyllobacterium brassicacearum]|uniref:Terminase small subunit n=2 Tax=Phyllobacterium brassicacearum TaxID=314235 RepID=A0A2P7BEL9_9HYPH|nr:Terminase small subunit [Phyllobacterium brassicacearum]TDQ22960.1 terminase small subunit [Phyllobacterium brassicacearum]
MVIFSMPALSNLKWEAFAQAVVQGGPASRAYSRAYRATGNSAEVNAAKLLRNTQVAARVAELQNEVQAKTMVTVEGLTRDLFEIKRQAMIDGKYAAAVSALELIAKMHGFLIDRSEQVVMHRPAPLPTKLFELSEEEWRAQFSP